MTNGKFYNHFSFKEALSLEVVRSGFTDWRGALNAVRETQPTKQQSLHLVTRALAQIRANSMQG